MRATWTLTAAAAMIVGCTADASRSPTNAGTAWSPPTVAPASSGETRSTPPTRMPSTCVSPPTFDEPLLVADARTLGAPIVDAWTARIDDTHRLVIVATQSWAVYAKDIWWTTVDLAARTVMPLSPLEARLPVAATLIDLGGGVAGWMQVGGARLFVHGRWSAATTDMPDVLGLTPQAATLDADHTLVFWPFGGTVYDHEKTWSPAQTWNGASPRSARAIDDGYAFEIAMGERLPVSERVVDPGGGWTSGPPSPMGVDESAILDDGTILATLLRLREGDPSHGEIWTTSGRAPRGWSAPAPVLDVDGRPLVVDALRKSVRIFPRGGSRAELVIITDSRVVARSFDAGAWGPAVDLAWPSTAPLTPSVWSDDGRTAVVMSSSVARVLLDDGWSKPIGITPEGEGGTSGPLATTNDGVWMWTIDAHSNPGVLFADARSYVVTRTSLPSGLGELPDRAIADAAGALVIVPRIGASAVRVAPGEPARSFGPPKESYDAEWAATTPSPRPRTELFAYAAPPHPPAHFAAVAWNAFGEATYETDAVGARVYRTAWEDCGGAILYGVSQFGTSPLDRTLLLLSVH